MNIFTSINGRACGERESGASVVDINFINEAAAAGHRVVAVLPTGRAFGVSLKLGVTLAFSGVAGKDLLGQLRKLIRTSILLIDLYRTDPTGIFRVNSFFSSLLEIVPLIFYSRGGVRLFVQFHHKDHSYIRNFIARQVMRHAGVIVCPSKAARQELIEVMGMSRKGLYVVHHGVDERFFSRPFSSMPTRGVLDKPLRLLFVGHLEHRKNPFKLLSLAKQLHEHVIFEIIIVGTGPELAKMREACKNENWATTVTFLGEISDEEKIKLYAQSDLFVFPSKQEGFGLVLCEAMASGLPVLAFNTSAMPEIIRPGTGCLVRVDDTAAMADIISCLAHDRELLLRMSQSAMTHARINFRWQHKVKDICRHLETEFRSKEIGSDHCKLNQVK